MSRSRSLCICYFIPIYRAPDVCCVPCNPYSALTTLYNVTDSFLYDVKWHASLIFQYFQHPQEEKNNVLKWMFLACLDSLWKPSFRLNTEQISRRRKTKIKKMVKRFCLTGRGANRKPVTKRRSKLSYFLFYFLNHSRFPRIKFGGATCLPRIRKAVCDASACHKSKKQILHLLRKGRRRQKNWLKYVFLAFTYK